MIKKNQRYFNFLLVCLDVVMLITAYLISYLLKESDVTLFRENVHYLLALTWELPLIIIFYFVLKVYSPMRNRLYRKEVIIILRAHSIAIGLIFSILYSTKQIKFSREILFSFGVLSLLLVILERFAVRKTLRYFRLIGYNQKHMLIVGAGATGCEFARKVKSHRDFGYNLVGFLDDDPTKLNQKICGYRVLGGTDSLPTILSSTGIDEVIIALPLMAYIKCQEIIDCCEKEGIRLRIVFDLYNVLPGYPQIEDFDGVPLLNTRHVPLDDPFNKLLKRIEDLIFSILALIFISPIIIFIAVAIKLTSRGPVFFRQERVGLNNKTFNILKFRSMRVEDDLTANTKWTTLDDPRKTALGTFLRKTSLDELPQFINVLRGDMSVVGPRPERPFFVEQFKETVPKYMVKHHVKPGITGWAQVNGWRGDTSIEKRIECDIYYIENWDILFDLKIMFMTVFNGLINKNAY